jgi:23S rRNA (uracil1939-C5)-methyltransferase
VVAGTQTNPENSGANIDQTVRIEGCEEHFACANVAAMSPPLCEVAPQCGGCPLLELTPEQTREHKLGELRRALARELGSDGEATPIEWFAGPIGSGYRHRLRLKIHDDGSIHFFNQNKSIDCPVLEAKLREKLPRLIEFASEQAGAFEELCHLEVRACDLDGKYGACFYPRDATRAPSPRLLERLNRLSPEWIWAVAHDTAKIPYQRHALLDLYHYVPLTSFLQVNRTVNDLLVANVVTAVKTRQLSSFFDCYAGAGNFTLPLLAAGLRGTAVEYDQRAILACELSAIVQGFSTGSFLSGDAHTRAQQLAALGERYDVVIVDPPRAGLKDAVTTVSALSNGHLVYCSCNLSSLSRDLRALAALGWHLESISAYDLFAGTRHLETCVWLRKH